MAFSEAQKVEIRKKAHLRCCLCHSMGVEVHHIVPQARGGTDDIENGAPLCPSCHEIYGANAEKQKFVREARDFWYEYCERGSGIDSTQIREISNRLETIATKSDLEKYAIQNRAYILGAAQPAPWENLRFSFTREEYVHPLIVSELSGWISDAHETVIAIDLASANHSNRFFGEYSLREYNGRLWVEHRGSQGESFCYSHIATSPSGVQMVECYDCGGGSGIFGHVLFLSLECDRSVTENRDGAVTTRERILLKTLGSIGLGDRYNGTVFYEDEHLVIGPDEGWHCTRRKEGARIPVK
jgi:hypothetical protein